MCYLREMIVKVSPIHEVQDEAEFVGSMKGVCHADNEGTVMTRAHQTQHYPLIQRQGLSLLHLDSFLVQTLKICCSSLSNTFIVN